MAATARIKFKFTVAFRGTVRAWSTSVHLSDAVDTQAHFDALADAIHADMQNCFYSDVGFTGADYYAPGSDVAEWTRPFSGNGTRTHSDDTQLPAETVALLRFDTDQRTTKNHPIYLFNYMHGARGRDGTAGDLLNTDQRSALASLATNLFNGYTVAGTTYKRAGPHGAVATGHRVEEYVTSRDFRKSPSGV